MANTEKIKENGKVESNVKYLVLLINDTLTFFYLFSVPGCSFKICHLPTN